MAPTYSYTSLVSGVPMYDVLVPLCSTRVGYHVFIDSKVN